MSTSKLTNYSNILINITLALSIWGVWFIKKKKIPPPPSTGNAAKSIEYFGLGPRSLEGTVQRIISFPQLNQELPDLLTKFRGFFICEM